MSGGILLLWCIILSVHHGRITTGLVTKMQCSQDEQASNGNDAGMAAVRVAEGWPTTNAHCTCSTRQVSDTAAKQQGD
jgi:hypothetical protein